MLWVSKLLGFEGLEPFSHDPNLGFTRCQARLRPMEGKERVLVVLKGGKRVFQVHNPIVCELLPVEGGLNVNSSWHLNLRHFEGQLVCVDLLSVNFREAEPDFQIANVRLIKACYV